MRARVGTRLLRSAFMLYEIQFGCDDYPTAHRLMLMRSYKTWSLVRSTSLGAGHRPNVRSMELGRKYSAQFVSRQTLASWHQWILHLFPSFFMALQRRRCFPDWTHGLSLGSIALSFGQPRKLRIHPLGVRLRLPRSASTQHLLSSRNEVGMAQQSESPKDT